MQTLITYLKTHWKTILVTTSLLVLTYFIVHFFQVKKEFPVLLNANIQSNSYSEVSAVKTEGSNDELVKVLKDLQDTENFVYSQNQQHIRVELNNYLKLENKNGITELWLLDLKTKEKSGKLYTFVEKGNYELYDVSYMYGIPVVLFSEKNKPATLPCKDCEEPGAETYCIDCVDKVYFFNKEYVAELSGPKYSLGGIYGGGDLMIDYQLGEDGEPQKNNQPEKMKVANLFTNKNIEFAFPKSFDLISESGLNYGFNIMTDGNIFFAANGCNYSFRDNDGNPLLDKDLFIFLDFKTIKHSLVSYNDLVAKYGEKVRKTLHDKGCYADDYDPYEE